MESGNLIPSPQNLTNIENTNLNDETNRQKGDGCCIWLCRSIKIFFNTTKHLFLESTYSPNKIVRAIKIIITLTLSLLLLPFTLAFIISKIVQDCLLFPLQDRFIGKEKITDSVKEHLKTTIANLQMKINEQHEKIENLEPDLLSIAGNNIFDEPLVAASSIDDTQAAKDFERLTLQRLEKNLKEAEDTLRIMSETDRVSYTFNGKNISAYLIEATEPEPEGVCIFFQPNATPASVHMGLTYDPDTFGNYHCLFPDYPGYGNSDGSIYSEKDFVATAEAAYRMAKVRYPNLKVVVMGSSIGTGAASYLAGQYHFDVKRVILHAPYTSITNITGYHATRCIAGLFGCYDFNSQAHICDYIEKEDTAELLIIHSQGDKVVPHQHGLDIYRACEKVRSDNTRDQRITLMSLHPNYGHRQMPSRLKKMLLTDNFDEFIPEDFQSAPIQCNIS